MGKTPEDAIKEVTTAKLSTPTVKDKSLVDLSAFCMGMSDSPMNTKAALGASPKPTKPIATGRAKVVNPQRPSYPAEITSDLAPKKTPKS